MLPAREFTHRYFIGCRVGRENRHLASIFDQSGRILHDVPLPGRGHGLTVQPTTGRVVVFARRPGDWALVLNPATGAVLRRLAASDGRHFYGHGAFSPDGTRLYTSENRFEDGAGVIGVWDVTTGWRRVREWPSHGVGPHEIAVLERGQLSTLAVANGGVRTHPDTGRAKLNLDTMRSRSSHPDTGRAKLNLDTMHSSLTVLDAANGRLMHSASFGARLHRLSIRHLDVCRDNRVVVAMQHQGSRQDRVPLVAYERDSRLLPLYAPDELTRRMRQYAGSVTFDASGRYVAVSHPHEGIVSLWATRPAGLIAFAELADTCGIACHADAGAFIATGAGGRVARIDARTGELTVLARSEGSRWDNHLLALGALTWDGHPDQVAN